MFLGEMSSDFTLQHLEFIYDKPALLEPKLDGVASKVGGIYCEAESLFESRIANDVERVSKEIALKRRICDVVQDLRDELENTRKVFDIYPYMFFEGLSPTKVKRWNDGFAQSLDRVKRLRADVEKSRSEGVQRSRARVEKDAARTLDDVILRLFDEAKRTDEEYRRAESMLDSLNAVMLDYSVEDFLLLLEVLVGEYSRCIDDALIREGDVRACFGHFFSICLKFELEFVEKSLQEFKEEEMKKYGYFSQEGIRAYLLELKSRLDANDVWRIRQECPDDEEFFRRIYKCVNRGRYVEYKKLSWEYSYVKELQQEGVKNKVTIHEEKETVFVSTEAKERALELTRMFADFGEGFSPSYIYTVLIQKLMDEGLLVLKKSGLPNVSGVWRKISYLTGDNPIKVKKINGNMNILSKAKIDLYHTVESDFSDALNKWSENKSVLDKLFKCKEQIEIRMNKESFGAQDAMIVAGASC